MEKSSEAKVVNGIIKLTDWQKIQNIYRSLARFSSVPNWTALPFKQADIIAIKNDLIKISQIISTEHPHFSNELFYLKDFLFIGYGSLDPQVYGQIMAIFKALIFESNNPSQNVWGLIHPQILAVSKKLFLDGHYANAACDAFIEINSRVKRMYKDVCPTTDIPDGQALMNKMFSDKEPLLEICDRSDDTGVNIHNGTRFMFAGAMAALRNPKAHANITITAEDAMRRLMFASMLMYTLDEVIVFSGSKQRKENQNDNANRYF